MATGIRRDIHLRQENILSENSSRGTKDLKSSGIIAPRRPVLNDISSNLQPSQNPIQRTKIAIAKPVTRLTTNLNRTTTTVNAKNCTKTVIKVNSTLKENVSSIPKAISRPRPSSMVRPLKGTLTRSSSLRSKSIVLTEAQKKEQEWLAACKVDAVDKNDEYDPFLVGAYSKSIFEYMLTLEAQYMIKPDYLANHKYITPSNRSVVVDWLVEVQQEFQIMQESLYTAVGILDRYLQENENVARNKLQLIGATSLLLGCKYEEIYVPEINDFVYLSDNAFTKDEVKSSLVDVFRSINYSLSRPFSLTFLRRFSKVSGARSSQHSLAKYFLELSLVDYNLVHVKPSEMAVSGLLLAIVITNDPQLEDEPENVHSLLSLYWTEILKKHSTYKINDIISTVQSLAKLALNAPEWKYKAVYKKYQSAKMGRITTSSLLCSPAMRFIAQSS
ncbi:G2/mitotic-specific cyclin-B2 [Daktulosphaira vitifoliae]|uniref:G2/mitotic-specific cyclin-B2 n=1 Tax=Daktulosphaira vitifoliae TaxID=58002 RepID=UPI0021AA6E23|nr:G2/mitotic-specific cyclin-B2 [Daktulosphaira vitifoliae]XP_050539302.1 G2/mitotic-specific cyclin-B2 [Daktulosphaira vitifoliae]